MTINIDGAKVTKYPFSYAANDVFSQSKHNTPDARSHPCLGAPGLGSPGRVQQPLRDQACPATAEVGHVQLGWEHTCQHALALCSKHMKPSLQQKCSTLTVRREWKGGQAHSTKKRSCTAICNGSKSLTALPFLACSARHCSCSSPKASGLRRYHGRTGWFVL